MDELSVYMSHCFIALMPEVQPACQDNVNGVKSIYRLSQSAST